MKTIRWAIIGLGRFGAVHASAIKSMGGSELVAVCNRNEEKLAHLSKNLGSVATHSDYRSILQSPDVDAVSITTHWREHHEIAAAALRSGKHVFLEKPMAASSIECDDLLQIAKQSPGFLMIGHVCRFDPRAVLAREAILRNEIGQVVSMHAKRNLPQAPGHIRLDKISPLMGDGIHDADLMMWFTQQRPSRVFARNVKFSEFKYPDLGWAMLEFGDETVGVIETVWCLPENSPTTIDAKLEVIGTNGKLTVDCSHTGFHIVSDSGINMPDTVYWPEIHGRRTGALVNELTSFAECIRNNRQPEIITPDEAAAAVKVMEAAESSAASGNPVDISWK